ncbi:hypothetical protein PSHI8_15410 [Polynucleobacter sp. SHI8]|nr:hypothetical protein PSHI2_15400 [Polynucleobacter sp. SHI2]BDW13905.1 hypothetical protein PSHI8_15410 [Polynucleobacter sp. SHI8]
MESEFPVMSRRQIIDALMTIRCSNQINKKILRTTFAYHEAFTDTEMATLWFQHFGDVVRVGNSRLHDMMQEEILITTVMAQIIIDQVSNNSRKMVNKTPPEKPNEPDAFFN